MPVGRRIEHNGAVYEQINPADDCCLIGTCSVCWRRISVNEPPRPINYSSSTRLMPYPTIQAEPPGQAIEGNDMPIPSTATRKKKIIGFKHPAIREYNKIITNPKAICYTCQCSLAGRREDNGDEDLMYCEIYRESLPQLVCTTCREDYDQVTDGGVHRLAEGAILLEDTAERVSLRFAETRCYQHEGHYFSTAAACRQYMNQFIDPTYRYHQTTPISAHGWPTETAPHELCFGIELEMEHKRLNSEEGCKELSRALGGKKGGLEGIAGKYILARDGSLNSSGVELITSPYTLAYHQKAFGWEPLLEKVRGIGKSGAGTTACGMHVHCNRQAISALTLGKMLLFVNHPSNKLLIERIAQRGESMYSRKLVKKVIDGKRLTSEKYDALHITEATIECRIFRGNLRPERVLKNIEFCHALISYCAVASIQECKDVTDFVKWLGVNRGTYKHLVKFLAPHYNYTLTRPDKTEDL